MPRSLVFSLAIVLCSLPATASAATLLPAAAVADESPLAGVPLPMFQLRDDDASDSRLRALTKGRVQVGLAVGMQAFQMSFAILARVLALALDQWAVGDSLALEGLISLGSIPFAPLGVVGFKKLASDPRRGVGNGLLEGGIYALSYAGLHLLFSGIAALSPAGGQGGDIGFLFVGIPIIVSHVVTGLGMTIAAAVVLARNRSTGGQSAGYGERGDDSPVARPTGAPLLVPVPMLQRDGAGLALVAVF